MLVHFRWWRLKRRKTEENGIMAVFEIYCPPVFKRDVILNIVMFI